MIGLSALAVTAFGIAVTIGAYALSLLARRRYPSPLTTPVLFSTVIIISVLLATGISFSDYQPAKTIMTFLLGPATVALAIPLYKNREAFFRNLVPAGIGLLAGSLGTMITAGFLARLFRFGPELVSSIAIRVGLDGDPLAWGGSARSDHRPLPDPEPVLRDDKPEGQGRVDNRPSPTPGPAARLRAGSGRSCDRDRTAGARLLNKKRNDPGGGQRGAYGAKPHGNAGDSAG